MLTTVTTKNHPQISCGDLDKFFNKKDEISRLDFVNNFGENLYQKCITDGTIFEVRPGVIRRL